jgi:hypothetical protein
MSKMEKHLFILTVISLARHLECVPNMNSLIGMLGAWKAVCEVMCSPGHGVLFSSALAPVPSMEF